MATSAPQPLVLKRSYRSVRSLEQFYGGGPIAVSSDGSFLACACGDEIKIVDSSDSSTRATLGGDSGAVTALALSPDDKFLYSAGHSLLIHVWDLSSNKSIRSWKGDGPIMSMACHSSGGLLATGGADKKVCVWDVDGGFCTHYFRGHQGVVTSIMFHNDPNRLILFSGSDDASVRIWNLENKKCIKVLEKHFSSVTSLALSQDGQILLSAGRDKVINIWDLKSFSFKMTVPTYEMIEAVFILEPGSALSSWLGLPNNQDRSTSSPLLHFLTVGERGIIRIWRSEGAVCIYEQQSSDTTLSSSEDESRRGFISATLLPSDQGLLCVTADQQFLFYSPMKSAEGSFELSMYRRLVGYNDEILDMKFLGDEEQYLAVATNLEQVRVYDVASMSCTYVLAGHTDIVVCLDTCISTSGKTLVVTGSKDKTVRLWDTQSKCCIGIGRGHMEAVGAVAFSKKFKNFFVSGSSDRTIKVWNFNGASDDMDKEGSLKAKAVVAAHDKDINSLAISPNDSLVCSGSEDRTACIWRLPDLVSVSTLKGHKRGIWSVEFSPVDQCVMTSSGDRTIKIWSVSDGTCLKTFEGHTSSVLRASFISRGTQFVSCGGDGLVKLWTIKSSECVATYDQHDGKVWALAIGRKTEMLATGGTDALVNLWQDYTASDKLEAFQKEEDAILRGQELDNAISDADYTKAIQLAFELRRPHKLLELFSHLCRRKGAENPMDKTFSGLGKEEIHVLLEYVREWNTKPKLCHVAQFVLFRIFRIFPPNEIMEIKGICELLEGLIPYSQRHFNRVDRLVRSTYLLDYVLTRMSVIEPISRSIPGEDKTMMSGSSVADQDGEPHSNVNATSLDNGATEKPLEEVAPRKRKSGKSKKVSEKKIKLAKQTAEHSISVEG